MERNLPAWRLHLLRAVYLMLALGTGLMVWPKIVTGSGDWSSSAAVVKCMLAALSLLAIIGLWRPVTMLPVLLWEITWKGLWLLVVALPAWRAGTVDDAMAENAFAVAFVVIVIAAVPWRVMVSVYRDDAE